MNQALRNIRATATRLEGVALTLQGISPGTFTGRQALRLAAADLTVLAAELERARNALLTVALESALADQGE